MILLHRISDADLKYSDDIRECLIHNSSNSSITRIIIFSDVKDIDKRLVVDHKSRKVLLVRTAPSYFDMVKYAKKISKKYIIFSNPFIKFIDVSAALGIGDEEVMKDDHCYYVFGKNLKIADSRTLDDILPGKKIKGSLHVEKLGYHRVPGFPIQSIGWNINRVYNSDSPRIDYIKTDIDASKEIVVETKINDSKIDYKPVDAIVHVRSRKIDVVIVSVNYNDFLILSLENNAGIFDRITVVTSPSDFVCQKICMKFGVKCVVTDRMYEDGAVFNKGKAINEGIKSLHEPDFILLLDADIMVMDRIDDSILEDEVLYSSQRYMIPDYECYQGYISGSVKKDDLLNIPLQEGLGFFQLFDASMFFEYPESSDDASTSDLIFRDRFSIKKFMDVEVLHLGVDSNWKGRKSRLFLDYDQFDCLLKKSITSNKQRKINNINKEVFNIEEAGLNWKGRDSSPFLDEETMSILLDDSEFDVNEYFDKIYCLNLDRREDRWDRVKREFNRFGLIVDRFSAVDGQELVYDNTISIERSSDLGLIENSCALGCLKSHIEMIKDAKSKGYNRILIFEDDILISEDFHKRISLLSQMDWKIFYLGASQFDWSGIHIKEGYYRCRKTLGTFAYALDCSVYDEILEKAEGSEMSIDNILSAVQAENMKKCLTFFPNIVISDVSDSNIRIDKNMLEYSISMRWNLNRFDYPVEKVDRIKVLLVPDIRGWAFDNIAKAIIKYNPYPKKIEYDVIYVSDIISGKKFNEDEYDLIYVFFEAERCILDGPKVIRGCYSAYWLENASISPSYLSDIFQKCAGVVFANDDLRSEINLPSNFPTITITDSADEKMFYPIELKKKDNLTAIFVGNTKRPIKRFSEIEEMCREAGVDLMVCSDIRNDELVNHYNLADICINFSDSEGGPQTFVESALCGIPMLIKSSNSLSKKIPCFTGDGKDDFVRTLKRLNSKKGKKECEKKGREARFAALKDFTYSMTAKKFSDFFIGFEESPDRVDLRNNLTVFVIRFGENPNYPDCISALRAQNSIFRIVEISNISPMSKAFQRMIDVCETKYYIQVDEDMVLFEDSILRIYHSLSESEANIASCSFRLRDSHLDFNIYGIKGYKHDIMDRYHYNLNTISCEMEQVLRYQKDGYQMLMSTDVLGYHSPKWTNELIFERYFDLMEKWKIFKYDWLGELPAKLRELYASNPSENNFYALMGAMNSLFSSDPIRKSEKDFSETNFLFERIRDICEIVDFRHIVKDESSIENHWTKFVDRMHVLDSKKIKGSI